MGNIMIGIKRFLKNKNTVTILAILAALGILYWAYYYRIQKATEPVNVPYATRELPPRTLITNEMVSTKKVPGGIVSKNVLTANNDIVGKYVTNTAVIPEGGLFYTDMIVTWEELPSSLFENIPDGNTPVNLRVDIQSTYGNSIYPGNYIDLYYNGIDQAANKRVFGKFIESIKVLAVTDSYSKSVFETTGAPAAPAYLMFSVPDDIFVLLSKAGDGTLIPVPRNAAYSNNPHETRIASSYIQKLVEKNTISDDILYQGMPKKNTNNTSKNTINNQGGAN